MADTSHRQPFSGTVILNEATYSVVGTMEKLSNGTWRGTFETPCPQQTLPPLCVLTIEGQSRVVVLGRSIKTVTTDLIPFRSVQSPSNRVS